MSFGECLLKTLFCPCILGFQAFRIYVLGCLGVYFDRCLRGIFCGFCILCNCCLYEDKAFPPTPKSIGAWNGKSMEEIDREIEWVRLKKICSGADGESGVRLFADKVEPADIAQGQVGDCWLMSALACLANVEGGVQRAFITREYTAYGRYRIRLFDKVKRDWVEVLVDDWIPVKAGTRKPLFAQPNGDEGWVLLLEKAMAKLMGSYSALDGGSTLWAFEALTGNYVFKFKYEPDRSTRLPWRRYDMMHVDGGRGKVSLQETRDELDVAEMFATIVFYSRKRSVIAASSGAGSDSDHINGIVQGHAYSVINAREVQGFKLVQLRNPWGTFEWQGDWSSRSQLWSKYPKVAKALNFTPTNDGVFWMEFDDFVRHFRNIDFCFRTTGWDDLWLDVNEEDFACGPCKGCITGCLGFWCCCKGVRALCCANQRQHFQRAPTGCCADCVC